VVDEPEPYESPPVASRFRVSDANVEAGAPQSFELRSQPRTHGVAAVGTGGPVPAGGPKFGGSPIVAPVGLPAPRGHRRPASATPTPGTFNKACSRSAPRPWRRTRRRFTHLVLLAVLAAGAYVVAAQARSSLADRSMPAALVAYVHGTGVSYAPAGQGYAVRLPSQPGTGDVLVAASRTEPALLIHRSIVSGTDFEIVIRAVDRSGAAALHGGLTGALHDAQLVGDAPTNMRRVVVDDTPAVEYDLHASPTVHARIVMGARHLYVFSVRSPWAGAVLDALTQSVRLSG